MDVLLINNLNFGYKDYNNLPNIGLMNLASILHRENIEVDIYDFSYEKYVNCRKFSNIQDKVLDQIVDDIFDRDPKILGFTTMNDNYPFVIDLSSKIKKRIKNEKLDDIYIILGGPQASLTAKDTMENFSYIDMVMIGEGEGSILFVIKSILENSFHNLESVSNLVYRDKNDIITTYRDKSMIDIDYIELIDSRFLNKFIVKDKIKSYPIDVGRGCPFSCSFCSTSKFWNRMFRLKSNNIIIEEIEYIKSNYDIDIFSFEHDLFTVNKKLIIQFCEKLKENNVRIKWGCSVRIDTIDEKLIDTMISAGCHYIYTGLETGSQRIQKIINKNINLTDALKKIKILSKKDIKVTVSFMYGFKEEKIEDLHLTLALINELIKLNIKNIQLHRFTPFPGTKEFDLVKDNLYFEKDRINGFLYDKKFIKKYDDIITNNINCFSNFCEFSNNVRDSTDHLSEFVYALEYMHRFFNYIYWNLMKRFEEKYIYDIYKYYKYDLIKIINGMEVDSTHKSLEDKFLQIVLDFIEHVTHSLMISTNNKNCIYMFHLGREALLLNHDSYKNKVILDYPVDVVFLQNTKCEDVKNEETRVCISKNKNSRIKVQKLEPAL